MIRNLDYFPICEYLKTAVIQVPRVELEEMGPRLELSLRRSQPAAPEVETLAMKQPKTSKKKVCYLWSFFPFCLLSHHVISFKLIGVICPELHQWAPQLRQNAAAL